MNNTDQAHFIYRGTRVPAPPLPGGLYIVSTPIGNLGDMTLRGLETLAACSVIACEDTRNSGVLLKRFGIDRPRVSYNEHNAATRGPDLLRQIGDGASVALISDAGTPLVSDPGFRLVRQAAELGYPITPLPGASAPLAALVASGLASEDFRFCGFLPNRQQARQQRLNALSQQDCTLMFFESPNRIKASLTDMAGVFGADRRAVVAREMTKMHETFYRGTLQGLVERFGAMERIKGEIVIVVEAAPAANWTEDEVDRMLGKALSSMKTKQAAAHVAQLSGRSTQNLYKRALVLKDLAPKDNE